MDGVKKKGETSSFENTHGDGAVNHSRAASAPGRRRTEAQLFLKRADRRAQLRQRNVAGAAPPAGQETVSYANLCVCVGGVRTISSFTCSPLQRCYNAVFIQIRSAAAATAAGTSQGKYVWGRWRRFVFRTV